MSRVISTEEGVVSPGIVRTLYFQVQRRVQMCQLLLCTSLAKAHRKLAPFYGGWCFALDKDPRETGTPHFTILTHRALESWEWNF